MDCQILTKIHEKEMIMRKKLLKLKIANYMLQNNCGINSLPATFIDRLNNDDIDDILDIVDGEHDRFMAESGMVKNKYPTMHFWYE